MELNSCMIDACGRYFQSPFRIEIISGYEQINESWNLLPLCKEHHEEVRVSGLTRFSERRREVTKWLILKGWEYNFYYKKWHHKRA